MLTFYRPSFRSGVMVIEDLDDNDKPLRILLKAEDNGKSMEFVNEAHVAAKYPQWFLSQPEFVARKKEMKDAKQQKRNFKH